MSSPIVWNNSLSFMGTRLYCSSAWGAPCFFSSRRRHTRSYGDWSSDVCSSDLWMSPTHTDRALPDLRGMLDLPFGRVIISHGEPVHTREAFERALELPEWPAGPLHLADRKSVV